MTIDIQVLSLQADQLMKEYAAGKLSNDEYKELVNNMGMQAAIDQYTSILEENLHYRDIILTAVNIAVALA